MSTTLPRQLATMFLFGKKAPTLKDSRFHSNNTSRGIKALERWQILATNIALWSLPPEKPWISVKNSHWYSLVALFFLWAIHNVFNTVISSRTGGSTASVFCLHLMEVCSVFEEFSISPGTSPQNAYALQRCLARLYYSSGTGNQLRKIRTDITQNKSQFIGSSACLRRLGQTTLK